MEYQLLELIPTIDSHCVLLLGSSPINPNIASTYSEGNLTREKLAILGRSEFNVLTSWKCLKEAEIVWEVVYCELAPANCLVFSPVRS